VADDRERDKFEADLVLRATELELKYGTQVDIANIRAMMERERNMLASAARQGVVPQ